MPGIGSKFWVHPWLEESVCIWTKWTQFNSLLFLLSTFLLIPVLDLCSHRTMTRIVDINVGSRSRVGSLDFFVAWAVITAAKCSMNGLFGDNFVLDVILLFLVIVCAWSNYFRKCLSGVRGFALVLPEFPSLGFCKERLRLLAYELAIWILLLVFLRSVFYRECRVVGTWSRVRSFDDSIFAVGHLRLEDLVLARWIELFRNWFHEIIDTWAWVICPRLIVMPVVGLLEKSAIDLTQIELVLRCLNMNFVLLWSVSCWSNLVETTASISRGCQFPSRNTRSNCIRNDSMVLVLGWFVFQKCLVDGLQVIPFRCLIVMTGVRVMQVWWPLNKARAWSCRSKSRYLCK